MKIAVYPGTFDPITIGHIDIAKRSAKLFDKVYVLVSTHQNKTMLFDPSQRLSMAQDALKDVGNIEVLAHDGLTLTRAKQLHACALIRGVRQLKDYEYELNQAMCNAYIDADIETILLFADAKYAFVSSSAIKELARYHQPLEHLVSDMVADALNKAYQ